MRCHWCHFMNEWHQWHQKNKQITHRNTDIQRFISFVQWVQLDDESNFFLNHCRLYSENIYLWRNNILIRALHCKKENVSLQCPAGEIAGYVESVFCFILISKSPISNKKGRDNSNAHSVSMYIMLKGQPMLYPYMLYIFQCENIVSSSISCEAFGDAWNRWAGQVSHFLFIVAIY